VFVEKTLHKGQYVKLAEHYRRGDIDPAAWLNLLPEIHRFEFVIGCQQSPAAIEITLARIGQCD